MGPWHWKFLAFGNSQIRENGAFFICRAAKRWWPDCDTIRSWMGRFTHIPVIAKYAARLGQCSRLPRLIRGITAPSPVKVRTWSATAFALRTASARDISFLASMVAEDWRLNETPVRVPVSHGWLQRRPGYLGPTSKDVMCISASHRRNSWRNSTAWRSSSARSFRS